MAITILDVGQCGFDGPRMADLWHEKLGATVIDSDTGADAVRQLEKGGIDLVLVNRVLNADRSSGVDLIPDLLAAGDGVPVMLVSDRIEAQDAAVALGAVRGFGKADLDQQSTLDLVKKTAKR